MSIRRYDDQTGQLILNSSGGQNDDGTTYYIEDHDTNLIFATIQNYLKYKALNGSPNDYNVLNVTFPHILFNNYANQNYISPITTVTAGQTIFLGAQDPLGNSLSGYITWTASPSSMGTFSYPATGASGYATFSAFSSANGQQGTLTCINRSNNTQMGTQLVYIN